MNPFFDHPKEEGYQEIQIENTEEQDRRISGEEDPCSLVQRDVSNLAFPKEKPSTQEIFTDQTMNISASHESAAPLITLAQCQQGLLQHFMIISSVLFLQHLREKKTLPLKSSLAK